MPENLLSWALLDAFGGDVPDTIKLKEGLEDAATSELRIKSADKQKELTTDSARKLIEDLRHDW